jgi:hypothetical protein
MMRIMNNVNSIRPAGETSLRVLCEVRSEAQASKEGSRDERDRPTEMRARAEESVNDRKAAASSEGGWRQNGRKREREKQGDLPGTERNCWPRRPAAPPGRSQSVHTSREAPNERGAKGRRKVET